jgi:hydroxymethylglutaryl-CoA reductase (NADPH)
VSLLPTLVRDRLEKLRRFVDPEVARDRLAPRFADLPAGIRFDRHASPESVTKLLDRIDGAGYETAEFQRGIVDPASVATAEMYARNIENYVGTVKVPVGLVGPLRVNGLHANGDFLVPLATTEAALVASYARGATVATKAGGISAALLAEGVLRSPAFVFADLFESGRFVDWIASNEAALQEAAEKTTRYGKLVSIEPYIDGEIVFLICRYTTGDASGQNMVTIATEAMCRYIAEHAAVKPRRWYVEGNFSGDKKASFLGMLTGRGRKVTASIVLPKELIERLLRTTTAAMLDYAKIADLGARLNGQIGAQGHYANGLAAFYIATGQDAACVAESAVGSTRMEDRDGDLFMSVTMPNILVGSVGGGTGLPSQSAALSLLGLRGPGKAAALAEVTAALCLCGEISIMAAISAGHFAQAHDKLARGRS